MDREQLRLSDDLLEVMRHGVTFALDSGAAFVAPPHLVLALLESPAVGNVLAPLLSRARVERAAADAARKLPGVVQLPEGPLSAGAVPPFPRYDTLAFRSRDRARTLYLDAEAQRLFIEGAQRAVGSYEPKHLALGFSAEAVKDRALLELVAADPTRIAEAMAR